MPKLQTDGRIRIHQSTLFIVELNRYSAVYVSFKMKVGNFLTQCRLLGYLPVPSTVGISSMVRLNG